MENLLTERYDNYNIYVTKSTSTDLSNENLCASINRTVDGYYGIDISCLTGKILSGDQIVIQRINRRQRIVVHDVRVYRKYIFFMRFLNT